MTTKLLVLVLGTSLACASSYDSGTSTGGDAPAAGSTGSSGVPSGGTTGGTPGTGVIDLSSPAVTCTKGEWFCDGTWKWQCTYSGNDASSGADCAGWEKLTEYTYSMAKQPNPFAGIPWTCYAGNAYKAQLQNLVANSNYYKNSYGSLDFDSVDFSKSVDCLPTRPPKN